MWYDPLPFSCYTGILTPSDHVKLKVAVRSLVESERLQSYLDSLWESLCALLNIPSRPQLLHNIEVDGANTVFTWMLSRDQHEHFTSPTLGNEVSKWVKDFYDRDDDDDDATGCRDMVDDIVIYDSSSRTDVNTEDASQH